VTNIKEQAKEHNKRVKAAGTKRKKPLLKEVAEVVNSKKLAQQAALERMEKEEAKIIEQFSGGREFDRAAVAREGRCLFGDILRRTIELGKLLVWGKSELEHGEYEKWYMEEMGIGERMAQHAKALALRAPLLKAARLLDAKLSNAIVLIQELDDEELQQLADTGEVRGITADHIEGMTRLELKRALRKEKTKIEAKESEIDNLARTIAEQKEQIMELKLGSREDREIAGWIEKWQWEFSLGINRVFSLSGEISEQAQANIALAFQWFISELLKGEIHVAALFPKYDTYTGPDRAMLLEHMEAQGRTGQSFIDGEPQERPEKSHS